MEKIIRKPWVRIVIRIRPLLEEENKGSHLRDDFNKIEMKFVGEFLFYKDENGLKHKFIKKDNI